MTIMADVTCSSANWIDAHTTFWKLLHAKMSRPRRHTPRQRRLSRSMADFIG